MIAGITSFGQNKYVLKASLNTSRNVNFAGSKEKYLADNAAEKLEIAIDDALRIALSEGEEEGILFLTKTVDPNQLVTAKNRFSRLFDDVIAQRPRAVCDPYGSEIERMRLAGVGWFHKHG